MREQRPYYHLDKVKRLVREGRFEQTSKSMRYLWNRGLAKETAGKIILSLETSELIASHPPHHVANGIWWADVYKWVGRHDGIEDILYVKFVIDENEQTLVLMSCKPWGSENEC